MSDSQRTKGIGAVSRVTALAGSVMDLHVRIALQEMDREKRRLISGVIFITIGGALMLLSLLSIEIALVIWLQNVWNISLLWSLLIISLIDITIAGLSFRIGGQLAKGPYLPETLEGIARTTKAVLGKS